VLAVAVDQGVRLWTGLLIFAPAGVALLASQARSARSLGRELAAVDRTARALDRRDLREPPGTRPGVLTAAVGSLAARLAPAPSWTG
jgi:hypothetical protein